MRKTRWINICLAMLIFAGLFVFFFVIHPLIIFDGDDWYNIYYARTPFPSLFSWNPTRILPEILMPTVSSLAAYVIYPLIGDYIGSLSLMYGLVFSGFIWAYVVMLKRMTGIRSERNSLWAGWCTAVLFLIMHFLVFRIRYEQNGFLFASTDVTCVFFYLIPCLLNFIIVLGMERWHRRQPEEREMSTRVKAAYVLLIYLAVFSNLYSSIILAAYAAISLLMDLFENNMTKGNRIAYIAIVVLWILSCLFEMTGGRASAGESGNWLEALGATLLLFRKSLVGTNKFLVLQFSVIAIAGISILFVRKKKKDYLNGYGLTAFKMMLCAGVTVVWLILLSSVVNPEYIFREDVLIAFWGFVFIAGMIVLTYFVQRIKVMRIALPLLLFFSFFQINTSSRTFKDTNYLRIRPEMCKEIDNKIINQLVEADKKGLSEVVLHIPKFDTGDNWPHPLYAAETYADALYKHGVIRRKIAVTLYPDQEMADIIFGEISEGKDNIRDNDNPVTTSEAGALAAVDLGLSVKWASFNLGADCPERSGEYYAWGEMVSKEDYDWMSYKWCNDSEYILTKYNTDKSYGFVDKKTVLDAENDVAGEKLGDGWRIPTDEEWTELRNDCTWQWIDNYNGSGEGGCLVSSENGNAIFLPAAGFRYYSSLRGAGSGGYYWSSSLSTDYHPYNAWTVYFNSTTVGRYYIGRFCGYSVRPVFDR